MPFYVLNTITPVQDRKQRVEEILESLTDEIRRNEPDALQVQVLWDDHGGVFHVYEVFTDEDARNNHHNMTYTAHLRRVVQQEHLAKNIESRVVDGLAGFSRN